MPGTESGNLARDDFYNGDGCYTFEVEIVNELGDTYTDTSSNIEFFWDSNENNNPDNLWYGYIDEIRLWDIALHDSIINFHNQYPTKVSKEYNSDYLPSLNGLWTFRINISENNINNIFQDINDYLNYTIIYTLEGMSNELSEIGR